MGWLRSPPAFLVLAIVLSAMPAWAADPATRCCATRLRASGAGEKQLFRCQAEAAAAGTAVDPACIAAAGQTLGKNFARHDCPSPSDADLVRADLERLVSAAATALRPTSAASTCAARKLKAAGRLAVSAARALSRFAPKPQDHLGELTPTVNGLQQELATTFARLETRTDCLTSGDATAIGVALLSGPGPIPPDGLLLETLRLCPSCGDYVRGGTEECDGIDAFACNGPCRPDCTCPSCGDGVKNQTTESCDGADAAACQGLCRADCTCPPPVCGNGVKESGEACDGAALGACAGCQPDCTCGPAVCGNGVVEPPEQCEGTTCNVGGFIAGCRPDSCTCCGYPCSYFGCCDPDEVCMPSPTTGFCFKFLCDPGEQCNFGFECISSTPGRGICAGRPGTLCFLPDFSGGLILPCVPPSTCTGNRCCLAAGETCSSDSGCCSNTCSGGTCS